MARDNNRETQRPILHDIFEQAPAFMAVLRGPQHVIEMANERFFQLVGRRDVAGKPVRQALPDLEGQGYFEILDGVYATGEAFVGREMKVRICPAPGAAPEERVVEFVYQPLNDGQGQVTGILIHGVDLTDRKQAEAALRESTSLLRAISDTTGDVLFAKDRQGRLTYANPAALALIGKPLDQVIGRTDLEFLQDKEAARLIMANDWRIMASGVAEDLEEVVPLPDGAHRVWFSRKMPYRDPSGAVVGLLGVSRDITERKRADDEAKRVRQQLETMIASINDGLLVIDREWRYTYFSKRAAQILGVRVEDMVGRVVWDLFPSAKGTKFHAFYHKAMETQQPQHFEEYYPKPLNQWLECHCHPSPEGLTVYFQDVTERRKAQEAAAEAHRRLDAAVIAGEVGCSSGTW